VLGVVDGTSVLVEAIPQSSGSHSVAADCNRNTIFVPQPASVVGPGGDTTTVGQGICGSMTGCVAVYTHPTKRYCLRRDLRQHQVLQREVIFGCSSRIMA